MGRNIFQSDAPIAMLQAVRKVVHEGLSPSEAYEVYRALRGEYGRAAPSTSEAAKATR
jgi:putative autoinducer-2 (AI-2) aldolase